MTRDYGKEPGAADDPGRPSAQSAIAALRAALADGGKPLLVILGFAILARIAFVAEYVAANPLAGALYSDARLYHEWAIAIAGGDLLGVAEPYHHPPLYPYLLGLVYAIAGPSPLAAIVLQSLTGPVVLLVIYTLARLVAPRRASLAALACAAGYLPMPLFETRLLAESATTAFAAFALFHLSGAAGPRTVGRLLLGGLLLGAACALRPNELLALPFVAFAAGWLGAGNRGWSARLRDAFLVVIGGTLAIAPFTARNVVHAGEFVLLCDTGGVNLYLAHHENAGASFRVPDPTWGNVEDQPRAALARAATIANDRDLSWREASTVLARAALRFALENPATELRLLAARARAWLDDFEYEVLYSPEAERTIQRSSNLFPISFLPIAMFSTAGIWAALACGRRRRDPAIAVSLGYTLAQILTVLLFFQYARFRVVALPALVPLAALGAAQVWSSLRASRASVTVFVAIGAGVVSALPRTTEADEQVANQHVTIAGAYREAGRLDEALAALDRAAAANPGHPRLFLERSRIALAQDDRAAARAALEAGLEAAGVDDPVLLSELARLLMAGGDDLEAATAFARRAVAAAPGFVPAHEALGLTLIRAGDDAALLDAMRRATALPAPSATLYAMLGRALRRTGDHEGAVRAIEEALRRDPDHKQALAERAESSR